MHQPNHLIRAVLAALLLALAACSVGQTGYSAPYIGENTPEIPVVMPPNAPPITQQFRFLPPEENPSNTPRPEHGGIDVVEAKGYPVIAAAPGVVTASFVEPFFGARVVIDHGPDETGRHIITKYFHLEKRLARKGDVVARGQQIGTMGRSGTQALKIHLHFEVHYGFTPRDQDPVDPHRFWVDGPGRVTCFDPRRTYPEKPPRLTYPVPCHGIPRTAPPAAQDAEVAAAAAGAEGAAATPPQP